MDDELVFILILVAGSIILLALLAYNRKKTFDKLKNAVEVQRNPRLLLSLLDDKFVKMTLTEKERLVIRLDGCIAAGDNEGAISAIKRLDTAALGKRDRVSYYHKRLGFYVSVRDAAEAEKSYDMLCQSAEMAGSGKEYEPVLQQGRLMLGVFIRKDTSLIPELQALSGEQGETPERGITEYLLARLYHAKGDAASAAKAAKNANTLLKGTAWETAAKQAAEHPSSLGK